MTKPRRLTLKQRAFAKEYVKTKNGQEAVKKVYDVKTNNVAGSMASENLSKPTVRDEVERLLEGTEDKIKKVIDEGLEAKTISKTGKLLDTPNYGERRKMTEFIARMKGYEAPRKHETLTINLTAKLEGMTEEQLQEYIKAELNTLSEPRG